MIEQLQKLLKDFEPEFIAIRRHLHEHPELSGKEYQTADFICSTLDLIGIPYQRNVSHTGVVAFIEGGAEATQTIALRADMDALPVVEETKLAYTSKNHGIMHACGHDMHMAMVLYAGKLLYALKDHLPCHVKLIFQPSEEEYGNGAKEMIENGVLELPKVDRIFGIHVDAELPVGVVGFKSGAMMAASDEIHIHITGKSGHIAYPNRHVNPAKIAAHLYCALEEMKQQKAPENTPSILDFGEISVLGKVNVVVDSATMSGAFRTFDEQWRRDGKLWIKEIAEKIALQYHGHCEVTIKEGYPVLINDEALTSEAMKLAKRYLGDAWVKELALRMGAEDFAYYGQHVPACFFRIGSAVDREVSYPLHSSRFQPNEKALQVGAGLLVYLVLHLQPLSGATGE